VAFEDARAHADIEEGEGERTRDRLAEAHDFGRGSACEWRLRDQSQEKNRLGDSAAVRHGRFPLGSRRHWPSLANVSI